MYHFSPPSIVVTYAGPDPLFSLVRINLGVSLLKENGFYVQVREPDPERLAAAELFYLGGHDYDVDDVEAAALIAAGYAPVFFVTDTHPGGYGTGAYGSGFFGE